MKKRFMQKQIYETVVSRVVSKANISSTIAKILIILLGYTWIKKFSRMTVLFINIARQMPMSQGYQAV